MTSEELRDEKVKKIGLDLQQKMDEAFDKFEQVKDLIPILEKYLDLFDEKITPMYELAKKTKDFLEKFIFTTTIFGQAENIVPFLRRFTEKKENIGNMSI